MFRVRIYPLLRIKFQQKYVNAVNAIHYGMPKSRAQNYFLSDFAVLARAKCARLIMDFMRAARRGAVAGSSAAF